ncbi:MFS transporter [Actinacidiphila paucisporea]|uniref:Transmembrane secretion effector n=1 Tax=Actinacidiphila paucisporea TaxID=310782 RepID=A0A1M7Q0J2_9ACTN|nr:MFS transporter [Actinacidiphila paucisporea]SHN23665.1 Transmembrane secretion effector [Actinacidiphila paucisporea]
MAEHDDARLPRLPPWAGRNFQLLVGASFVTGIGNSGATIAAAFAVIESGGSATDVGLVAAARTLAMVVLLLVGGAVADRLPRQRVMAVANVANAGSQALFAVLVLTGHAALWQMAALTAVGGGALAFFSPAAQGLVLSTVDSASAGPAISVYRLATNTSAIGGAALGGALVAAFGAGWVLAVDAAGFAVAAAMRSRIDVAHAPRESRSGGMLRELREGWQVVASTTWLWSIVLQFSVVNGMFTAVEAVYGPLVSRDRLGGAGPWGLALAAGGAGTAIGAVLMMRWRPRRILLVGTLGVFPLALPAVALALVLPAWALAAVMFAGGVAIEVFAVNWMLAMHQEIPEDLMSRVAGFDWMGSVALTPVALALAGPAASLFGRTRALWGSAGLIVLLTVAVLLLPDVRRMERRTSKAAAPEVRTPVAADPAA